MTFVLLVLLLDRVSSSVVWQWKHLNFNNENYLGASWSEVQAPIENIQEKERQVARELASEGESLANTHSKY